LRLFEQHKDIGLIGPVTNSAGNEQRIELEGINAENYESIAGAYTKRQAGVWFTTEKLGFFCVAMRRSLVDKVGYLDEQFGIGMFEDDDYCIRVKKEGYRLAVVEDCFVFHKGSVSFKKLSSDAYAEIFSKNQSYFYKKHDLVWTYSDISLATWARLKSDFAQISDETSPVFDRIQRRISLMDDSLYQAQQAEVRNISIDGQSMSEKLLLEKHQQLMEISDWASELKQQNEDFVTQLADRDKKLAETHRQLMEMSDWASELKLQNEDFVAQIADRDNKLAGMHLQLMEMSDWANELKQDRDQLHDELKKFKTTFLYRLVAWTKKSQS